MSEKRPHSDDDDNENKDEDQDEDQDEKQDGKQDGKQDRPHKKYRKDESSTMVSEIRDMMAEMSYRSVEWWVEDFNRYLSCRLESRRIKADDIVHNLSSLTQEEIRCLHDSVGTEYLKHNQVVKRLSYSNLVRFKMYCQLTYLAKEMLDSMCDGMVVHLTLRYQKDYDGEVAMELAFPCMLRHIPLVEDEKLDYRNKCTPRRLVRHRTSDLFEPPQHHELTIGQMACVDHTREKDDVMNVIRRFQLFPLINMSECASMMDQQSRVRRTYEDSQQIMSIDEDIKQQHKVLNDLWSNEIPSILNVSTQPCMELKYALCAELTPTENLEPYDIGEWHFFKSNTNNNKKYLAFSHMDIGVSTWKSIRFIAFSNRQIKREMVPIVNHDMKESQGAFDLLFSSLFPSSLESKQDWIQCIHESRFIHLDSILLYFPTPLCRLIDHYIGHVRVTTSQLPPASVSETSSLYH